MLLPEIFFVLCVYRNCVQLKLKIVFLLNSNEIVVSREELQLSNDTSVFLFNLLRVLDALPVNVEVRDVSLVALSVHSIFPSEQSWFYISKTCTIKIVYILWYKIVMLCLHTRGNLTLHSQGCQFKRMSIMCPVSSLCIQQ